MCIINFANILQVVCKIKSTGESRTIPVIARVSDKNDNSPIFVDEPYEVSISEVKIIINY